MLTKEDKMSLEYLERVFTTLQKDLEILRNCKDEDIVLAKHMALKSYVQMLVDSVQFLKDLQKISKAS